MFKKEKMILFVSIVCILATVHNAVYAAPNLDSKEVLLSKISTLIQKLENNKKEKEKIKAALEESVKNLVLKVCNAGELFELLVLQQDKSLVPLIERCIPQIKDYLLNPNDTLSDEFFLDIQEKIKQKNVPHITTCSQIAKEIISLMHLQQLYPISMQLEFLRNILASYLSEPEALKLNKFFSSKAYNKLKPHTNDLVLQLLKEVSIE